MQHLDRSLLERYAHGHVLGAEAHDVELHLERCALCREAVEGLASNKAHLPEWQNPHTRSAHPWMRPTLIVVAVVAISIVPWLLPSHDDDVLLTTGAIESPMATTDMGSVEDTALTIMLPSETEIAAAMQIVPAMQIGHEPIGSKPPLNPADIVVQRDTILIAEVQPVEVDPDPIIPTDGAEKEEHVPIAATPRDSRQLIFLHNLKLVHPQELYGETAPSITDLGVSARFASSEEQAAAEPETRPVQYLDHFDAALAAFARSDHKRALTDLRIVLAQYPDDINALFYTGLSCYNLGLFTKAERYFARAAAHPVRTFDEEALWYQALSVERSEGTLAAEPLFVAIANGGGFYAAQAFAKLK
ncbi:MAG: hypothetical protein WAU70_07445 [Flavobacteriales bacterium]